VKSGVVTSVTMSFAPAKIRRLKLTEFENETWLINAGAVVIDKKRRGETPLTPRENLVYCIWVADYAMRNAGDLATAYDLFPSFDVDGRQLAKELSLRITDELFSLSTEEFQQRYFDLFHEVCEEIKGA
jgi:hypothetical protein